MTARCHILTLSLMVLLLSSCHHKGLDFTMSEEGTTRVTFDWSLAPQATPEGMLLVVFSGTSQPVTLHYENPDGGALQLPGGNYHMVAYNDNMENVSQRGSTWESHELYCMPATLINFAPMFAATRTIPRAPGTESENVVYEPDPTWCASEPDFMMDGRNRLTMSMESVTEQYNFTITNVVNLENVVEMAATVSGMSGTYLPALSQCGDYNCIIPFSMEKAGDDVIQGTVRTFGNRMAADYLTKGASAHKLVIYLRLSDSSKYYATFDVTDAIHDARIAAAGTTGEITLPITIDEFAIPEPLYNGTGLHPEVSEWQEMEISIRM